MAKDLEKVLRRRVYLHGVDAPVNLFVTPNGVEMAVVGFRKRVFASWEKLVGTMHTSHDCPSYLFGKPMELLKHQATQYKMSGRKQGTE